VRGVFEKVVKSFTCVARGKRAFSIHSLWHQLKCSSNRMWAWQQSKGSRDSTKSL